MTAIGSAISGISTASSSFLGLAAGFLAPKGAFLPFLRALRGSYFLRFSRSAAASSIFFFYAGFYSFFLCSFLAVAGLSLPLGATGCSPASCIAFSIIFSKSVRPNLGGYCDIESSA